MPSGQPAGRRRYKERALPNETSMKATIVDKAIDEFLQSLRQRNASVHTSKPTAAIWLNSLLMQGRGAGSRSTMSPSADFYLHCMKKDWARLR